MGDSTPLIKICGVTCVDDALACADLGANWIGLNFHPRSSRYIEPSSAATIVRELPSTTKAVGVFVDCDARSIVQIANSVGLFAIQLHGHEPPELANDLGGLPYIKAFRLAKPSDWNDVTRFLERASSIGSEPIALLVDAFVPNEPGGTGTMIADEIMASRPPISPLILAGGLTPKNVAARTLAVRPWMVDAASGVESSPGRKDHQLLSEFINNVRAIGLSEQVGIEAK